MRCSEAAQLLNAIQLGKSPSGGSAVADGDGAALAELEAAGLVAQVRADDGALQELQHLKETMTARRREGAAGGAAPNGDAELRDRILELADRTARAEGSVEFQGRRYAVTYSGRNTLGALMRRLDRVRDLELKAFSAQMDGLRTALSNRAAKAQAIAQALAPGAPPNDGIQFRSAALGLSVRDEAPALLAASYRAVLAALAAWPWPADKAAMLAETVAVARGAVDAAGASAAVAELRRLFDELAAEEPKATPEDLLAAAAMLFPLEPGRRAGVLQAAATFRDQVSAVGNAETFTIAPWILVGASGLSSQPAAVAWTLRMRDAIIARGAPRAEAEMAASILGTSPRETGEELVYQFDTARDYMSRLSQESMVVPAAMLAVLSTGIDETLDDLRMASAEVAAKGLSLGGMENLSLGLKLLVQSALLATDPASHEARLEVGPDDAASLAALGLPALAAILPSAMAAFAAFHNVTLHRVATTSYAYHPIHTHYIYG